MQGQMQVAGSSRVSGNAASRREDEPIRSEGGAFEIRVGGALRGARMSFAKHALLAAAVGLLGIACERASNDPQDASPAAVEAAPSGEVSAPSQSEAGDAAATGTRTERVSGLRFDVPTDWISEPPESTMRVAQYRIPGPGGDAGLVLFRFAGGGGSAAANVERWIQQIEQPDGSPSSERAKVQTADGEGFKLTRLDVGGKFGGQQMPGAPPQPPIENARMLALVVEGPGDPYFFKLLGPADTIAPWTDAWETLIQSVALE